jgi:alpha-1,2-mannosyltransferase
VHRDFSHEDALAAGARMAGQRPNRMPMRWVSAPAPRLMALMFAAALLHLALWQISEPPTLFSDFYKAYFPAAEVLWEYGLAAEFPFTEIGAGGFVNMPVLAWLFVPLVPLGEDPAGWAFLAIGAAATATACLLLRRMARPETGLAPLALLFLLNGPLINSLREGNTTHFVLLMLICALMLLRRGSDFGAGVVLGLCAVIKLPLLLFGAYFLLRRRWMAVAGGTSAIGGVLLLSVAAFGLDNNVNWFNCCVEPFIGGIIPAFNVQSVDGFAVRLFTGTSRLSNWDPMDVPIAYKVLRQVLFAALLGYIAWTMLRDRADQAHTSGGTEAEGVRDMLEFALILDLALILSPISWSHYYALLLLPWGLYAGGRLPWPSDVLGRRLLWSAVGLCSLPILSLPLGPDLIGEIAARTLVSATFVGGVAMLAVLLRQLRSVEALPHRAVGGIVRS